MAESTPAQPAPHPLPPGLDLLWGRRERGKRGPRPGLTADAIVEAAMRVADTEGLEAVSMARVAAELGFTTMSLYRYVANKDELLQLMWNGSATGAGELVIEGTDWRARIRAWAIIQREMLDRHPWITHMPMAAPPLAPNSMHFVEHGLKAFDGTGLPGADRLRFIGLIASYTLSEARMAYDALRAMKAAAATAGPSADAPPPTPPDYQALLRELIDQPTYPRLYQLAWDSAADEPPSEWAEFLFGLDTILDGIAARIDRSASPGLD